MQDDEIALYDDTDVADVSAGEISPSVADPDSLGAILSKALNDIAAVGGLARAQLSGLIGKDTYEGLLAKPRVADAIDAYLNASPGTKKAAGRMLATHIARATDHPEVLDRIERELEDTFSETYGSPAKAVPRNPVAMHQQKTRAQQRSGQRVASDGLMALARNDDIGLYRQARLNPRGRQRQRRYG